MGDDGKTSKRDKPDRETQLAQALRANLRRRKAAAPAKQPTKPEKDG